MEIPAYILESRRLEHLVENQTTYRAGEAELHFFETHERAEQVMLQFSSPVLANMIKGRKVMHLRDHASFNFLPGESLILPSDEIMCIDFPDADLEHPTQCSAMTISQDKIAEVVQVMNETIPRLDKKEWEFMDFNFRFTNDLGIYQIVQRLFFLFSENHSSKDVFVDFMLKELVIRVLRNQYQHNYELDTHLDRQDHRIADTIRYIRRHIDHPLKVEDLSKKACMSLSHFSRVFKQEVGCSPVEFVKKERIRKALNMLKNPNCSIKEVYLACGFDSRSYFNRVFKQLNNVSPKAYQEQQRSMTAIQS